MSDWRMYTPDGTRDILFERSKGKIKIENILRDVYIKSGFLETISPTLEFYDVFNGESSPINQEDMYKLFDNQGRILALRPDGTIPMARVAATKLKDFGYPIRLCYDLNIFRMNQSYDGKMREITQSGIEIIGTGSIRADAEVIITAIKGLLKTGVTGFKIDLGQVDFLKGILEETGLGLEEKNKVARLIENKNLPALGEFLSTTGKISSDIREAIKAIPTLFGNVETLDEARKFAKNEKSSKALDNIREIYKMVARLGLGGYISIDLGMAQNIHYYTGITFRGYCREAGESVLSGGRYDNLMENFGVKASATGLAINVDNILQVLERQQGLPGCLENSVLIYYKENLMEKAYDFGEELRQRGFIAELSLLDKEGAFLKYADKRKYTRVIGYEGMDNIKLWNIGDMKYELIKSEDFIKELEG